MNPAFNESDSTVGLTHHSTGPRFGGALDIQRVIDGSPIPTAIVRFEDDLNCQILEANGPFKRAFGGASSASGERLDAYFDIQSDSPPMVPPTGFVQFDAMSLPRSGVSIPVIMAFSGPVVAEPKVQILYVQSADRKSLGVAASRARAQFQMLFDSSPDIIYLLKPDGTLADINEAGAHQLGYARAELLSEHFTAHVHEADRPLVEAKFTKVTAGETLRFEARLIRRDGNVMIASILVGPNSQDDEVIGIIVLAQDVTAQRLTQARLEESEQRYRALFINHIDAVITTDRARNFVHINPAFERMVGVAVDDLRGTDFLPLVVPDLREYTSDEFNRAVDGHTVEYKTRIMDGTPNGIDLHVTLIPVIVDGEVREIHCIAKDITAVERANVDLARMAFTHPFTGLPNRNALYEHLGSMVELGAKFSVHNLDLDRLKAVNDRYGRRSGDDLLKAVAGRLNGFVTAPTRLFQYSGDNFVIVHQQAQDEEVPDYASNLEKLLRAPFSVDDEELTISASIGVCLFPHDGLDAETLLRHSEDAMLEAKRRGRSHIAFYRELAGNEDSRLLKLEFALKHAIVNQELAVVYQPQIEAGSGEVHGVEALLRWTHPELGPISPAEFIPIAERNGFIHELGMWVVEAACAQLAQWEKSGHRDIRMAVNVSIDQFYDVEFYERLQRAIATSGIAPASLVIEVTESIAANADTVVSQLHKLKSLGIGIALDDFGTGYSSLQYLRDFPVDYLKIDRSFVNRIGEHEADRGLVATIIEIASTFGVFTVAEGVETGEQMRILRELGVRFVQGYHFSRPLPPHALEAWIDLASTARKES